MDYIDSEIEEGLIGKSLFYVLILRTLDQNLVLRARPPIFHLVSPNPHVVIDNLDTVTSCSQVTSPLQLISRDPKQPSCLD
jgi:hypothetical protein